jgi:hypothetical protein
LCNYDITVAEVSQLTKYAKTAILMELRTKMEADNDRNGIIPEFMKQMGIRGADRLNIWL